MDGLGARGLAASVGPCRARAEDARGTTLAAEGDRTHGTRSFADATRRHTLGTRQAAEGAARRRHCAGRDRRDGRGRRRRCRAAGRSGRERTARRSQRARQSRPRRRRRQRERQHLMRSRRRWIAAIAGMGALAATGARAAGRSAAPSTTVRLCTFGDSVLDCGHYNDRGLDPGRLLVHNDDALFPEFRGKDLRVRGAAELEHRAVDGAVAADLAGQTSGLRPREGSVAIVSVGGNDLLRGLAADSGAGVLAFEATLERFLRALPVRPVVLATVYDPTFGDDTRNFLGVPARIARANHRRVNDAIGTLAERHGLLADVHTHFLTGDSSWFTHTIEPSLVGASEVRRVFLARL